MTKNTPQMVVYLLVIYHGRIQTNITKKEQNPSKHTCNLAKLSYFTNLNVPEISWFPLLNYHFFGEGTVWGRYYNLIRYMDVSKKNGTPKSSHLFIGFSIIFIIHFGGKIPLFLGWHPHVIVPPFLNKVDLQSNSGFHWAP